MKNSRTMRVLYCDVFESSGADLPVLTVITDIALLNGLCVFNALLILGSCF